MKIIRLIFSLLSFFWRSDFQLSVKMPYCKNDLGALVKALRPRPVNTCIIFHNLITIFQFHWYLPEP